MEIQSVDSNDYGGYYRFAVVASQTLSPHFIEIVIIIVSSTSAYRYHASQKASDGFGKTTVISNSCWDAKLAAEHEDGNPRHGKEHDSDWGKSNHDTLDQSDTEQEADFMESDGDHESMETDVFVKEDQPQWQQDILNKLERNILELEERRRQVALRRELRDSRQGENTMWVSSDLQVEVLSVMHDVFP